MPFEHVCVKHASDVLLTSLVLEFPQMTTYLMKLQRHHGSTVLKPMEPGHSSRSHGQATTSSPSPKSLGLVSPSSGLSSRGRSAQPSLHGAPGLPATQISPVLLLAALSKQADDMGAVAATSPVSGAVAASRAFDSTGIEAVQSISGRAHVAAVLSHSTAAAAEDFPLGANAEDDVNAGMQEEAASSASFDSWRSRNRSDGGATASTSQPDAATPQSSGHGNVTPVGMPQPSGRLFFRASHRLCD